MTGAKLGRAFALALGLLVACGGTAFAHALPGSLLSLWEGDQRLHLSIALPVEDLAIAAPRLAELEELPPGQDLSQHQTLQVAAYFAAHLALGGKAGPLPLSVSGASLEPGETPNVGRFTLLVVELTAPLPPDGQIFPLALAYDAVMHEVRNHRATVYWGEPGGAQTGLADFGFRKAEGRPRPVLLTGP